MHVLQSLWRVDPWFASPFIFAFGMALLYVKWPVARISAVFFLVCGLVLSGPPGDPDDWWMAVFQVVLGAVLFILVPPRWFRNWRNRKSESHFRFSLRDLLIASGVFGLCLSFVLRAFQYRAEQAAMAELVNPILQNYVSAVVFEDGHVRALSTNRLPRLADPLYARVRECGFSHWYASHQQVKPFADQDLAQVVDTHREIRFLDLRQSNVTADGLAVLEELKSLEGLWLDSAQCAPIATGHLRKLKKLRMLSLGTTAAEELASFRKSLPECEIQIAE